MILLENVELSKYTTIRIGGIAKKMLIPENVDELTELLQKQSIRYMIGGGSNLLINNREFEEVVNLREFNKKIKRLENGRFQVGASVRLQELIKTINSYGYGGIEYLYSVPGLVGGAVVMNAGRGKQYNKCISDYIVKITVLRDGKIVELVKEECEFSYRNSIFKNNSKYIILSVEFLFSEQLSEEGERLIKERITLCKNVQDNSAPNFGSVFMESNNRIMKFVKLLGIRSNDISFSKKTANWILNRNNGTYEDVIKVMKRVELLHRLFGKKCKTEVIKWE